MPVNKLINKQTQNLFLEARTTSQKEKKEKFPTRSPIDRLCSVMITQRCPDSQIIRHTHILNQSSWWSHTEYQAQKKLKRHSSNLKEATRFIRCINSTRISMQWDTLQHLSNNTTFCHPKWCYQKVQKANWYLQMFQAEAMKISRHTKTGKFPMI